MNEINSSKNETRNITKTRRTKSFASKIKAKIIDIYENTDLYEKQLTNIFIGLVFASIVLLNAILFIDLEYIVRPGNYVPTNAKHTYATTSYSAAKTVDIDTINEPVVYDELIYLTMARNVETTEITTVETTAEPTTEVTKEKIFETVDLDADIQQFAYDLCKENNVPFEILMALIFRESSYDPEVISADGSDYGLCQIRKSNHSWLMEETGVTDFLDPYDNITAAVHILAPLCEKYKADGLNVILMCYNIGEFGARKLFNQGIYSTSYSRSIVSYAEELVAENN